MNSGLGLLVDRKYFVLFPVDDVDPECVFICGNVPLGILRPLVQMNHFTALPYILSNTFDTRSVVMSQIQCERSSF